MSMVSPLLRSAGHVVVVLIGLEKFEAVVGQLGFESLISLPSVVLWVAVVDFPWLLAIKQLQSCLHIFCTIGSRTLWNIKISSPCIELNMQKRYLKTSEDSSIRAKYPNIHVSPTTNHS